MLPRHTSRYPTDVPGFTSDAILAFVYDCVLHQQPRHCVEIGSYMGRSASVMCDALAALGGERSLHCVDSYTQTYKRSYLNTTSKRHSIGRCGPEVARLYSDFGKLRMLEDCFHLTMSRKPAMQRFATLLKGDSSQLDFGLLPRMDFAYLDGDHSYDGVRTDTLQVLSRLNDGGMIVFDDYMDPFEGVVQFVDEFAAMPGVEFIGREAGDMAYVVRKPQVLIDRFLN